MIERTTSWHFNLVLISVFTVFLSIMLIVVAAPIAIDQVTGIVQHSGFVTAVFSFSTVGVQLSMTKLFKLLHPSLMFRIGIGLITISAILIGIWSESPISHFSSAAVRGAGFGLVSVTSSLLVIRLSAKGSEGRALGQYGVAVAIPGTIGPSCGIYLLGNIGISGVFLVSGVLALIGLLLSSWLPILAQTSTSKLISIPKSLRLPRLSSAFLTNLLSMVAFGGCLSFAPLVLSNTGMISAFSFFLLLGTFRSLGRWIAGIWIDNHHPTPALIVGVTTIFLGSISFLANTHALFVIISGSLMGLGFGIVMTTTYLIMVQSTQLETGLESASSLWNLSIDGGVMFGSLCLGIVAGYNLDLVFVLITFVVLLSIPFSTARS